MKIHETIVSTCNEDGSTHLAPMGVWQQTPHTVLAPFKPSTTLDNLKRTPYAVINRVDDVRIFAGCLSGHREWSLCKAKYVEIKRLELALSHCEVEIVNFEDHTLRPKLHTKVLHEVTHAPFLGFNRAQSAVIELAILVSRLDHLPAEKIFSEIDYLKIAIEKTAGDDELEAWSWLMARVQKKFPKQSDVA